MFQLADIWTPSLEPDDYVDFLRQLREHVSILHSDGRRYLWKSEEERASAGTALNSTAKIGARWSSV